MKKIVLCLSAMCLFAFTSCKENAAKKIDETNIAAAAKRDASASKFPVLQFDKAEHDFGQIDKGNKVTTVFKYTNTGDAPLVITDIKSTCGCTVPQDWSRAPLEKGGTGEFSVTYNGSGKGAVTKTINITANTEKGKEAVKIKAFVKVEENGANNNSPVAQ